ncbi:MAG: YaiO family outer membrane beta-barrel protein [bacterium]|nr:YaiO family outer membrane beta-barrel protein [bacterium]
MKTYSRLIAGLLLLATSQMVWAEEQPVPEWQEQVLEWQMREKNLQAGGFSTSIYNEIGRVTIGERNGLWRTTTADFSYTLNQGWTPYLEAVAFRRFGEQDYTWSLGTYGKLSEADYIQLEAGFGTNRDYIYKWQAQGEYDHKLARNIFGAIGYRYRDYETIKVNIIYPGLIYYFGDNYASAYVNLAHTSERGTAKSVTLKSSFLIRQLLHVWLGTSFGERLYDVHTLPASDQEGYIIFYGLDVNVTKFLNVRLGSSYGREKPDFVIRSIDAGLAVKF